MKTLIFSAFLILAVAFSARSQTWNLSYSGNHGTNQLYAGRLHVSVSGTTVTEDITLDLYVQEPTVVGTEMEVWAEGAVGYPDQTFLSLHSADTGNLYPVQTIVYNSNEVSVVHYIWFVYYSDNTYEEYDGTLTY